MKPFIIVLQKKWSSGCGSQTFYSSQDKIPKTRENSLCACAQVYLGFQIHIKEAEFKILQCSEM